MLSLIVIMIVSFAEKVPAIIYRLNGTEYQKFPKLFVLDDYESCLLQPGGVYCDVELNLVSDVPSTLLNTIKEYSEQYNMHFNHTKLQYGVCATKRCHKYINNTKRDGNQSWREILEKCFNASLWENYQLKTRIAENVVCEQHNNKINIKMIDVIVALFLTSLLVLNIIASIGDIYNRIVKNKRSYTYLQYFSVITNFQKLGAPRPLNANKCLNGINMIKTLLMMWLIMCHSLYGYGIALSNPLHAEEIYLNILNYMVINASMCVLIYFVISGFLLFYNIQVLSENQKVSWSYISRQLCSRWLRLTPPYAVLLAFTCTWFEHVGSGPLWHKAVMVDVYGCRRDWWNHMLYINNYIDSRCMYQSWYLAADMQLYLLGLLVGVLIKQFPSKRHLLFCSMFILGLVTPALHTYVQNLDSNLMATPEFVRNYYSNSPKFHPVYKWAHTNIASSAIGIVLSYYVYNLQKKGFDIEKYKKYHFLYWYAIPAMIVIKLSGSIFYRDVTNSTPVLVRTVYATLVKPVFGSLAAILIFASIFKYEKHYRDVVEWRGWEILNRVSYSAYLLQFFVISIQTGIRTDLIQMAAYPAIINAFGILVTTYLLATIYWITVEAPLCELFRVKFSLGIISDTKQKTK